MASATDSALAAQLTLERVTAQAKRVYLWTFTFAFECDARTCGATWSNFWNRMGKEFPTLWMFRVFELHPGGHGWHVHAVCDRYLWVNYVRHLAGLAGFGRIDVKIIARERVAYVLKYVQKGLLRGGAGIALWNLCGKNRARCRSVRVRDIETESNTKSLRTLIRENAPFSIRSCGWERVSQWTDSVLDALAVEGYLMPHWLEEWWEIPWRDFVPKDKRP